MRHKIVMNSLQVSEYAISNGKGGYVDDNLIRNLVQAVLPIDERDDTLVNISIEIELVPKVKTSLEISESLQNVDLSRLGKLFNKEEKNNEANSID